ncbi:MULTISPECIES: imelysin family protein [unclassified Agarivorans]|uniref:imelysin family protein n=1 Tax=unclassified Agarivorans TaxID=2636026 RepID=UPI0026E1DC67|nr:MULTISPECIES: imelysin family protein [unclassified Agarivorans]MDO6684632.1 imelysin family protein [Agarivorans sp. 3_MG-2023]MDO6714797.1 imelysin family protein [Agarivorans sp. 2_MG-2023]
MRLFKLVLGSSVLLANIAYAEVKQNDVVEHYAELAHAVYSDSLSSAVTLQTATQQLINAPSEQSLNAAKQAWLDARRFYQQSEVFRFGNPVVDEWEGQLNAWPLDEGLIDYVATDYQYELGNPGATANIVANTSLQVGEDTVDLTNITPELLASLNELAGSEANVATGYHAVEFLLWGQDLHGTKAGAGERAYTDYAKGDTCTNGYCERRAAYLAAVTQLLIDDLSWMSKQWQKGGDYQTKLIAEPSEQALRRMMFGMGSLSLGELAGERMKVALEANSTEDEHDCFSDNTHNSHYYNNQGISNVYFGQFKRLDGSTLSGPSLNDLVKQKDSAVAASNTKMFNQSMAETAKLVASAEQSGVYFDQLIAASNTDGHALINGTILALVEQTRAIEASAKVLGIENLNPDTADHEF